MGIGAGLGVCWRRGGATRRELGVLAYLGTALVTSAVVAGGPAGDVFVPVYSFVAVVAAMQMRPIVAVRHPPGRFTRGQRPTPVRPDLG